MVLKRPQLTLRVKQYDTQTQLQAWTNADDKQQQETNNNNNKQTTTTHSDSHIKQQHTNSDTHTHTQPPPCKDLTRSSVEYIYKSIHVSAGLT